MAVLNTLESMLAGRYLRRARLGGPWVYWMPGAFLIANVAMRGIQYYLDHSKRNLFSAGRLALESGLRIGIHGTVVATVVFGFLAWLIRRYTVFSTISTFGLFLGSSALVVVLSVMSGFEQDLKHKILGANAHVLVTASEGSFTDYRAVADKLRQTRGVDSVMPYLANEVMVSSQANINGVIMKGIDPDAAAQVTDLAKNMEQGSLDNLLHPEKLRDLGSLLQREPGEIDEEERLPAVAVAAAPDGGVAEKKKKIVEFVPADAEGKPLPRLEPRARKTLPGILIGRELAKNLRLFLGDDVNVISPMGDIGPAGPIPKSRAFRVAGIFYSGMYEYDTKHVYMTVAAAQKFLSLDDEVTGLEVRVRDPDATGPVVMGIRSALADPRYEVRDWQELNKNLFSALKMEKILMFVVLCFIILVAGFSIIANGIMLVSEKEQQIAILKAMGAGDGSVLKTFLYLGLQIGSLGIGGGIGAGIAYCVWLQFSGLVLDTDVYYIARLPVRMSPFEVGAVLLASMAIALCAMLYPALLAAQLRPVDGLRRDHG